MADQRGSRLTPATLVGEGRVYGGGLYKMEPKELANVPAEAIAALMLADDGRPASQGDLFVTRPA